MFKVQTFVQISGHMMLLFTNISQIYVGLGYLTYTSQRPHFSDYIQYETQYV